jgi:hemerythrin
MAVFTRSEKVITAYTLAIVNEIENEGLVLTTSQLSTVKAFANKQDSMIRMGHTSTEASKEAIDKFFVDCLRHIAPEEDLMDWAVFIAMHNGSRIETVTKETDKTLSAMRSGYRSVRKGL